MRHVALLAAVAALLALAGFSRGHGDAWPRGGPPPAVPTPLYGLASEGTDANPKTDLVRISALTLRRLKGRAVPLGRFRGSWTFSPDRSRLAVAADELPSLRFVDLARMRATGDVRVESNGYVTGQHGLPRTASSRS